ncbi:alpha/beta fold hydrolase [Amycolatopsis carbonis]|uniref:alpha/beta fold hydrolase n=1 Tax=Amycolatopsis carbonis TaxID=715471 RepID=UPI00333ED00F
MPGHGGSPAELLRVDATLGDIAGLVLALADHLGIERFAYAGISMGGAAGLWLAMYHPDRVASLMLVSTSARFHRVHSGGRRSRNGTRRSPVTAPPAMSRASPCAGPFWATEVLLQSATYCGVPAANTTFTIANRMMEENGN